MSKQEIVKVLLGLLADSDSPATAPKKATEKPPERAVMVCTDKRGVFFGYATDTSGDVIHLRAARMAVYWSQSMHGVLGLAKDGPDSDCRISKPADIELRE